MPRTSNPNHAGRRTPKSPAQPTTPRPRPAPKLDLAAARTFAATHLPGAEVAEKFGNASFSTAGKVFAFTRPDGLVLKLPPAALAELFATREAHPLVMGKRTMREWAHLHLPAPDAWQHELPLLRAAQSFVASLL